MVCWDDLISNNHIPIRDTATIILFYFLMCVFLTCDSNLNLWIKLLLKMLRLIYLYMNNSESEMMCVISRVM